MAKTIQTIAPAVVPLSDTQISGAVNDFLTANPPSVADGAITNAKLANMSANTIKGSIAGGVPTDLTATNAKTLLAIGISDVANLQTSLNAKADSSALSAKLDVSVYTAADVRDKLASLTGENRLDASAIKNVATGTPTWADITGKPTAFPPETHTHVIADVTNLQTELNGKAATSHTHDAAAVTTGTFESARIPDLPHTKITGLGALATKSTIVNADVTTNTLAVDKLVQINTARILGRNTANAGNVEVLAASEARAAQGITVFDATTARGVMELVGVQSGDIINEANGRIQTRTLSGAQTLALTGHTISDGNIISLTLFASGSERVFTFPATMDTRDVFVGQGSGITGRAITVANGKYRTLSIMRVGAQIHVNVGGDTN